MKSGARGVGGEAVWHRMYPEILISKFPQRERERSASHFADNHSRAASVFVRGSWWRYSPFPALDV